MASSKWVFKSESTNSTRKSKLSKIQQIKNKACAHFLIFKNFRRKH